MPEKNLDESLKILQKQELQIMSVILIIAGIGHNAINYTNLYFLSQRDTNISVSEPTSLHTLPHPYVPLIKITAFNFLPSRYMRKKKCSTVSDMHKKLVSGNYSFSLNSFKEEKKA